MVTTSQPTRAPNKALYLTDYARSAWDVGALSATLPALARAPRGDGHAVLVIPGLGASDRSTLILRRFLSTLGYAAYGWELGRNIGPTARVVSGLPERLHECRARHDGPVSVIGWSLGGIFARQLGRRHPDVVRQVITLASPIRLQDHAHSNARRAYETARETAHRNDPTAFGGRPWTTARPSHLRLHASGRHRRLAGLPGPVLPPR